MMMTMTMTMTTTTTTMHKRQRLWIGTLLGCGQDSTYATTWPSLGEGGG